MHLHPISLSYSFTCFALPPRIHLHSSCFSLYLPPRPLSPYPCQPRSGRLQLKPVLFRLLNPWIREQVPSPSAHRVHAYRVHPVWLPDNTMTVTRREGPGVTGHDMWVGWDDVCSRDMPRKSDLHVTGTSIINNPVVCRADDNEEGGHESFPCLLSTLCLLQVLNLKPYMNLKPSLTFT